MKIKIGNNTNIAVLADCYYQDKATPAMLVDLEGRQGNGYLANFHLGEHSLMVYPCSWNGRGILYLLVTSPSQTTAEKARDYYINELRLHSFNWQETPVRGEISCFLVALIRGEPTVPLYQQ
jgi:hypothetical protein